VKCEKIRFPYPYAICHMAFYRISHTEDMEEEKWESEYFFGIPIAVKVF